MHRGRVCLFSGGAGAVKAIDISTFSPFTFASQSGVNPLPVELVSFSGSVQEEGVLLKWEAASEFNNSHFEKQQSADARSWHAIGRTEGKGTTHQLQQYTFLDTEKGSGVAYYRLKQVDFDGAFEYSSLVQLELMGQQSGFSLYTNSATDKVRIGDATFPAEVFVINSQGVTIWKATLQGEEEPLYLPNLANGVYTVQVRHSQGTA